jgi:sensor domain CHASE-containing protein
MIRIAKILGAIIVAGLTIMIMIGCENQNLQSVDKEFNQQVTIQSAPLHFRLEKV